MSAAPSLPAFGARSLQAAFSGEARARLESALGGFLQRQRWFGSKASTIAAVRVHDSGVLDERDQVAIAIVDVDFEDRRTERYALPVESLEGSAADEFLRTHPHAAIGHLDSPPGPLLADAMSLDTGCRHLGIVLGRGRKLPLAAGVIQITRDADDATLDALRTARIVRTGAEQSNSSVIFAGASILKVYRRLQAGPHPELEMGRYLGAHGFNDVPAVLASIEYVDGAERYALAVLHDLVAEATDGWKHALAAIATYFESVDGRPAADALALHAETSVQIPGEPKTEAIQVVGPYLDAARMLGSQTGRLHRTLAQGTGEAFAPEPLTGSDVASLVDGTRNRAMRALSRLAAARGNVPPAAGSRVDRLLECQARLFDGLDDAFEPAGAMRTRCHQDYHLGQLLWTGERYALLDFEGEPARPLSERRAKRSPLTDVAGMLRSYSYAAWSGLFAHAGAAHRDPMTDRPWAALWESAVAGAFMQRYLEATEGASFLPRHPAALEQLLRVLILDKALYELEYELNNRPDWILVPVEGLLALL